jgi:hypothetical protein
VPAELVCIIQHESGGNQFDSNGNPLISKTNDVGMGQLNLPTWGKLAKQQGLDIVNSATDNLEETIFLYNKYGGSIWTTDKYCRGSESG